MPNFIFFPTENWDNEDEGDANMKNLPEGMEELFEEFKEFLQGTPTTDKPSGDDWLKCRQMFLDSYFPQHIMRTFYAKPTRRVHYAISPVRMEELDLLLAPFNIAMYKNADIGTVMQSIYSREISFAIAIGFGITIPKMTSQYIQAFYYENSIIGPVFAVRIRGYAAPTFDGDFTDSYVRIQNLFSPADSKRTPVVGALSEDLLLNMTTPELIFTVSFSSLDPAISYNNMLVNTATVFHKSVGPAINDMRSFISNRIGDTKSLDKNTILNAISSEEQFSSLCTESGFCSRCRVSIGSINGFEILYLTPNHICIDKDILFTDGVTRNTAMEIVEILLNTPEYLYLMHDAAIDFQFTADGFIYAKIKFDYTVVQLNCKIPYHGKNVPSADRIAVGKEIFSSEPLQFSMYWPTYDNSKNVLSSDGYPIAIVVTPNRIVIDSNDEEENNRASLATLAISKKYLEEYVERENALIPYKDKINYDEIIKIVPHGKAFNGFQYVYTIEMKPEVGEMFKTISAAFQKKETFIKRLLKKWRKK